MKESDTSKSSKLARERSEQENTAASHVERETAADRDCPFADRCVQEPAGLYEPRRGVSMLLLELLRAA